MDVDLDLPTNFAPKELFNCATLASMMKGNQLVRHPCGTYFQNIAEDPITGFAAIPFKEAQQLGYFKIDFLHLSVLDDFTSKKQIRKLMNLQPDWSLLEDPDEVEKLFHIKNHFDLINSVKPTSVIELADCMALIRPQKKHLLEKYLKDREFVRDHLLYTRGDSDEYSFKKAHSIAYAFNVVLQMHLIKQGLL